MTTVTIACTLPGGLVLGLADAPNGQPTVPVVLNGPPYSPISSGNNVGAGFTEVDETFWSNWLETYGDNPIVTNGSVWEV